jgi:hypothetical protein
MGSILSPYMGSEVTEIALALAAGMEYLTER